MSLPVTIAVVAVLDVLLLLALAFAMTRPSKLAPHLSPAERIWRRRRERLRSLRDDRKHGAHTAFQDTLREEREAEAPADQPR
jgi:hypothetical protein